MPDQPTPRFLSVPPRIESHPGIIDTSFLDSGSEGAMRCAFKRKSFCLFLNPPACEDCPVFQEIYPPKKAT